MHPKLLIQLRALSDPIRMTLCALMIEHDGHLTVAHLLDRVCEILDREIEQSTISNHLHRLLVAGLVTYERHGLYNYYHFNHVAYEQALDALQAQLPVRARVAVA